DPVSPDRAVEVVLEVRKPVGGLNERRALTRRGPGESHVVTRLKIANRLRHGATLLLVGSLTRFARQRPRRGGTTGPARCELLAARRDIPPVLRAERMRHRAS